MNEGKARHTVWLTADAWGQVETSYIKDNCTTKADVLDGKLGALGSRIGKLLFKLAVEQDMTSNIVAAAYEIPLDDIERLRVRCIRDLKRTNGEVRLENAVRYQNGGNEQWSG